MIMMRWNASQIWAPRGYPSPAGTHHARNEHSAGPPAADSRYAEARLRVRELR